MSNNTHLQNIYAMLLQCVCVILYHIDDTHADYLLSYTQPSHKTANFIAVKTPRLLRSGGDDDATPATSGNPFLTEGSFRCKIDEAHADDVISLLSQRSNLRCRNFMRWLHQEALGCSVYLKAESIHAVVVDVRDKRVSMKCGSRL